MQTPGMAPERVNQFLTALRIEKAKEFFRKNSIPTGDFETCVSMDEVDAASFSSEDSLLKLKDQIVEALQKKHLDTNIHAHGEVKFVVDENKYQLHLRTRLNNIPETTLIDGFMLTNGEVAELRRLRSQLGQIVQLPVTLTEPATKEGSSDRVTKISSYASLKDRILEQGRKGAYIQRYKGLGEMNADQLGETTLSDETRTLLRVEIDDAVHADHIFSTLMGDDVDPRREFIQSNALNVKNLDI